MQLILSWLTTLIFLPIFGATLVLFHPLLILASLLNRRLFDHTLELMNFCIINELRICGTKFKVNLEPLKNPHSSIILVSNHQSMYDIPLFVWLLRRLRPKFVAKVELARFIPSISFALRVMGSALIDRKNPHQALPLIIDWAKGLTQKKHSACIFPEGTRARDGVLKKFKPAGFVAIAQNLPEAQVLPVVIDGSWKLVSRKLFPVPFGTTVHFKALKPREIVAGQETELLAQVAADISGELVSIRELESHSKS